MPAMNKGKGSLCPSCKTRCLFVIDVAQGRLNKKTKRFKSKNIYECDICGYIFEGGEGSGVYISGEYINDKRVSLDVIFARRFMDVFGLRLYDIENEEEEGLCLYA